MWNRRLPGRITWIIAGVLACGGANAAGPQQYFSLNDGVRAGGLWLEFERDERDWLTRFTEPAQEPVRSALSIDQPLGADSSTRIHWGAAGAPTQSYQSMGLSRSGLSLTGFRGEGDTVSSIFHTYNDAGSYQFHGGLRQRYDYSGVSLQYDLSAAHRIGFTQASISAPDLNDRTAREISFAARNTTLSFTEVREAGSYAGRAIDLNIDFGPFRAGAQYMEADNNARFSALKLATTTAKGRDLAIHLEQRVNPLFEDGNENLIRLSYGVRFGGAPRFNADETTDETAEGETENKQGNTGAILAGAGAVGAAVALSGGGGGGGGDDRARFNSQNEAGKAVLVSINARSIRENREYGGYVYRNADGSFSSTQPIQGEVASVLLPNPASAAPSGSVTTASYHTHAAFDRRFDSENFSGQDLFSDFIFGIDGYLGTPRGQFKFHDVSTGEIITLGGPGTLPTAGQ